MKAQSAVEYLIIVSVALLIIIPFLAYVNQSFSNYKENSRIIQAKNAVKKLGEAADFVYSQGPPAKLTIRVCIPEGVQSISFDKQILFKVKTSAGISDIFYETIGEVNGTISTKSGCYYFNLIAHQTYVQIGEAK